MCHLLNPHPLHVKALFRYHYACQELRVEALRELAKPQRIDCVPELFGRLPN